MTARLKIPRRIRSRRQWVRLSKLARDELVRLGGYPAEDFVRVGRTEPSLDGGEFYPRSFQRRPGFAFGPWMDYLPRNGVVYWRDGISVHDEPYDPLDPVLMLREIYDWQDRFNGGAA